MCGLDGYVMPENIIKNAGFISYRLVLGRIDLYICNNKHESR